MNRFNKQIGLIAVVPLVVLLVFLGRDAVDQKSDEPQEAGSAFIIKRHPRMAVFEDDTLVPHSGIGERIKKDIERLMQGLKTKERPSGGAINLNGKNCKIEKMLIFSGNHVPQPIWSGMVDVVRKDGKLVVVISKYLTDKYRTAFKIMGTDGKVEKLERFVDWLNEKPSNREKRTVQDTLIVDDHGIIEVDKLIEQGFISQELFEQYYSSCDITYPGPLDYFEITRDELKKRGWVVGVVVYRGNLGKSDIEEIRLFYNSDQWKIFVGIPGT